MMIEKKNITVVFISCLIIIAFPGSKVSWAQNQLVDFYGKPIFSDSAVNNIVTINFNIFDINQNRISSLNGQSSLMIDISESIKERLSKKQPIYVAGSFVNLKAKGYNRGTPSVGDQLEQSNLTASILVDRSGSMTPERIDRVNEAIELLLEQLPDGCAYISWFNNDVSTSLPITRESFRNHKIDYTDHPGRKQTALYNGIFMKLQEFDGTTTIINANAEPEYRREKSIYERKTAENYLIVLTDGKNDVDKIPKYTDRETYPDFVEIKKADLFNELRKSSEKNKVKVLTIAFVDDNMYAASDTLALKKICQANRNKQGYFVGRSRDIKNIFQNQVVDLVRPDYSIQFHYESGVIFDGKLRTLKLKVTDAGQSLNAVGEVEFVEGSRLNPTITHGPGKPPQPFYITLLEGLIVGFVVLLVVLILMHLILPLLGNRIFKMKYVTKYKPEKDEQSRLCVWCKSDLKKGQEVVVKCSHISHFKCWNEMGHQCPEYGMGCNEGRHEFFDINDPFSKKNAREYLNWVGNGMFAGILIWLCYQLLSEVNLFKGMTAWMVDAFSNPHYPESSGSVEVKMAEAEFLYSQNRNIFVDKINPTILLGALTGFFIPILLLLLEGYQKINFKRVSVLLFRGVIGLATGFIIFFLGGVLSIEVDKLESAYLPDIIPWVLFGPLLGYQLSVKTTILAKHSILGGLISIIFSFLILYIIINHQKDNLILFSIMIYGGGLGGAISTIRKVSENYFLNVVSGNTKVKDIPIHKWLKVYPNIKIGIGKICEIRADWDTSGKIDDVHLKMYMDSAGRAPVLVSETTQESVINNRIKMIQFKEYTIYNGDTFKLGDTVFRYEERD